MGTRGGALDFPGGMSVLDMAVAVLTARSAEHGSGRSGHPVAMVSLLVHRSGKQFPTRVRALSKGLWLQIIAAFDKCEDGPTSRTSAYGPNCG